MITKILSILILFTFAIQTKACWLNKFEDFIKIHEFNSNPGFAQMREIFLNSMKKTYGYSSTQFVDLLKANINRLPVSLQTELLKCQENKETSRKNCENMFGKGNCEENMFNQYAQKCPISFERSHENICTRSCSFSQTKIPLTCEKKAVRYLNIVSQYETESDCLIDNENCDYDKTLKKFVEVCMINEQTVGFMCVPLCLSEMSFYQVEIMRKDDRFCILDEVRVSSTVYEI